MQYKDITNEFITKKEYKINFHHYFTNNNGIKYKIDGKHVLLEPTQREVEVAKLLGTIFGGQINIIPKVNEPSGIKTPDYIINNEKFDLKGIKGNGKNTIIFSYDEKRKCSNNNGFLLATV